MSEDKKDSPGLPGKESIEKTLELIKWLRELWKNSNWSERLILLDVLLPAIIEFSEHYLEYVIISKDHKPVFYLAIGISFIVAVVLSYFEKPKSGSQSGFSISETRAIKGLRAFDFNDVEVFKRLQRNESLASCLTVITSSDFKFGVLYAESGCGKTSFLQAGLHHLLNNLPDHSCVYVKFSNEEPITTVFEALKKSANQAGENIPDLVNAILTQQNKSCLVLVFDQFEQFFLHHPQPQQRAQFLQAFVSWYQHKPLKLLISIRSDYTYALHELEQTVNYTPNWQEKFELRKFTPTQATEIFRVLADLNQLPFDADFVSEICRAELAKDAGLISPVDIQILAWLVAGFQQEEHKGFNKKLFLQKGGVEGLLENFLAFSIGSLSGKAKQELAIKVLLTLIDKEKNLRVGALKPAQIQEKLSTIAASDIMAMLTWLEDSKVRLITTIGEEEQISEKKYELAHEKLIKGVLNLASKQLEGYDRANLLLDQRVAEWVGNNKKSRYLLSIREYRFIRKNVGYLIWGEREHEKQALLSATKRYWQWQGGTVFIILFALGGWQSWLRFTPQGQIYECQMDLQEVNDNKFPTSDGRKNAVIAFLRDEKEANKTAEKKDRFKLVDISQVNLILPIVEKITDDRSKAYVFQALAQAAAPLDKSQALEFLKQLQTAAEKITDNRSKAYVFQAQAQAAAPLDKSQALEFLKQGKTAAEKITDDRDKADVFKALAQAATPLDKSQALEFLKQGKTAAEKITDDRDKADVFKALAQAATPLDKSQALEFLKQGKTAAEKITDDSSKAYVFQALAQAAAPLDKSQALEFLKQLQTAAEKITDNRSKADVFKVLAQAAAPLDKSQALEFLKQLQTAAEKITNDSLKADVFQALAEAAAPLDKSQALEFLKQLQTAAEKITDNRSKAYVFQAQAQAAAPLDKSQALEFLKQGKTAAEKITDDRDKADVFKALAQAATPLDKSQALEFLKQGKTAAEKITDDSSKAQVFQALAQAAAPLDKSLALDMISKAVAATKNIPTDARQKILSVAANLNAQEGHYREACQFANQNVGDDGALEILAIVLREYGKREHAGQD